MYRRSARARSAAGTDGQPASRSTRYGVGEHPDADEQHDEERHAHAAALARRGRDEHELALLVDRLDPAEIGVVGAGKPARRRPWRDPVPALAEPADDELDLRGGENREREPERDRRLQPAREQPEDDEAEPSDPDRRLCAVPREARHAAQGRGSGRGSVGSRL